MTYNKKENNYKYLHGIADTLVATGRGKLHSIVVNTTANGAIIVADSITTTTPTIATLKASVGEGTYLYDVVFTNGLFISLVAASDITVNYSQS